MKNSNLRGLDEDLNRGIKENRKSGGNPILKKILRRPENVHQYSVSIQHPNMLECPMCKKPMFDFQEYCYKCIKKI